jgi:hypothetical protein
MMHIIQKEISYENYKSKAKDHQTQYLEGKPTNQNKNLDA